MTWLWLLAGVAVLLMAYVAGTWKGCTEANKEAIGPGTWVEARQAVKVSQGGSEVEISSRVQALVTGVDKWERFSIWVASPWAETIWEGHPQVHGIGDYRAFRVIPPWRVDPENRSKTLQAFARWKELSTEITDGLFPPGWLELQRKLHGM